MIYPIKITNESGYRDGLVDQQRAFLVYGAFRSWLPL